MCEPTTVVMVATAALTAYSQYQQGEHEEAIGKYNAKVEEVRAAQALDAGVAAEDAHRAKVRQLIGQQRAAMGASGMEVDSGTFGDLLAETAAQGEMDSLTIRANAMREAWGYKAAAKQSRMQGVWAGRAGAMNSFGTILSGSARAYSAGKTAGIWGK